MARQNRVQPTGEIIAHPARGTYMGNRGVLHDADGHLGAARWRHRAWVTCLLDFKGRRRPIMAPNRYTELFFHDEAVAMAAGHRPCGECRRADFLRFRAAAGVTGPIADFDRRLHAARAIPRKYLQRRQRGEIADLPDGSFILDPNRTACLIHDDALWPFSPVGYAGPMRRPASGCVDVLTPEPLLQALRAGYRPAIRLPD
jgi:hypothetical protein